MAKKPAKRAGTKPRKSSMSKAKWDSRTTASFRKARSSKRKKSGAPTPPSKKTGQSRGAGKWGPGGSGTPGKSCGTETRTICRKKDGTFRKGYRGGKGCSTERIYVCRRSGGTFAGVGNRRGK